MSKYSIKDLEKITGVKAHTIRIWERRYGIIQPERTETNIRFYSDQDLKRLLNIAMLNASGIKISHLAKLDSIDLEAKVLELSRTNQLEDTSIEKLILSTVNFDEDLFESILSKCLLEKGMEETISKILFPFFERIGTLWQVGSISPAQEHFISNLIRQKLFVAIDACSGQRNDKAPRILFFLKEEELHEIKYSVGAEYWYANQFAVRGGYFHEHETKGNRKYFTVGAGLKLNVFTIDFSYLIPLKQNNPLANTVRFTLGFDFQSFKIQPDENEL